MWNLAEHRTTGLEKDHLVTVLREPLGDITGQIEGHKVPDYIEGFEVKTIFCDEAGFTGNRLLDAAQPYFAYVSIEIDPQEATDYVEWLRRSYRIESHELKGGNLCKRPRGQRLVKQVIKDWANRVGVAVFDKKYALAGKVFEYLVEPVVSRGSSLFYDIGLHKFVAHGLYAGMRAGNAAATELVNRFEVALRDRRNESLLAVESTPTSIAVETVVDKIVTFLVCNREIIKDEVVEEIPTAVDRWMLELSTTALWQLLTAHGGPEMTPLIVCCDDSRPLREQVEYSNIMVGRTDLGISPAFGRHQVTYNLAKPIQFASSLACPAVQLADIFASASVFALKNPDDELAQVWHSRLESLVQFHGVLPDPAWLETGNPDVLLNAIVFDELINRAVRRTSYFAEMPRLIQDARQWVEENHPARVGARNAIGG